MNRLKSWWILPPSGRYPPPELPGAQDEGIGQAKGSICPGLFIPPKWEFWNKIINSNGPLPYPPEMPVLHSEQWDMSWEANSGRDTGFSAKVTAPVAAAVGANINAEASVAFKSSVLQYWNFDKLDTYMVQPRDTYISHSLEDEKIRRYIKNSSRIFDSWEIYMISGIAVARGPTMNSTVVQTTQAEARAGAGLQDVAEGSLGANRSTDHKVSTSVGKMSDFVWAIQIARVYKNLFQKDWTWETLWDRNPEGSTFALQGLTEAKMQFKLAQAASQDEDLASASIIGLDNGDYCDNVFILPVRGRPRE